MVLVITRLYIFISFFFRHQFEHLQDRYVSNYCDSRLLDLPRSEHFDLDPLLIEFFNRGHREFKYKERLLSNDSDKVIEVLHPPHFPFLKFLPSNQYMFRVCIESVKIKLD